MDLVYDFIPPNLNPHLDVESILLMRMTSKKFICYKIQKNHNYIRNIKNNWGIFNYIDNEKDTYKISLYLEENFISDTIIKKLNDLFSKKNIYSIRILNNPVINYQSYSISFLVESPMKIISFRYRISFFVESLLKIMSFWK